MHPELTRAIFWSTTAFLCLAFTGCGDDDTGSSSPDAGHDLMDTSTDPQVDLAVDLADIPVDPPEEPGDTSSPDALDGSADEDPVADMAQDGGDQGTDAPDPGDQDGSDLPDRPDCGFDEEVEYDQRGLVWQLVSEDSNTCLRLVRQDACPPDWICPANPYLLLSLTIGHGLEVVTIDEVGQLRYEASWHNWEDVAEGTWGDTLYRLNIDYDGDTGYYYRFTFNALDADDQHVLWGPVDLMPAW